MESTERKSEVVAPVFDDSIAVDQMLNNDEPSKSVFQDAGDPTLTKITLGEITSFLAKTGHHQGVNEDLSITRHLAGDEDNCDDKKEEPIDEHVLEEMERIMIKMESVFATFKDPSLIQKKMPIFTSQ